MAIQYYRCCLLNAAVGSMCIGPGLRTAMQPDGVIGAETGFVKSKSVGESLLHVDVDESIKTLLIAS